MVPCKDQEPPRVPQHTGLSLTSATKQLIYLLFIHIQLTVSHKITLLEYTHITLLTIQMCIFFLVHFVLNMFHIAAKLGILTKDVGAAFQM